MSNKTLAYSLTAVVVAFAAVVFAWNSRSGPGQKDSFGYFAYQTPQNPSPLPESNLVKSAQCKREFDEKKLNSAKVSIKNRAVEMAVKDFGKIKLEFYEQDAPKAVENFLRLVNAGFYDCLTFHRVAKGFVIQGGDPLGNGTGGQSAFGKPFADELNPDAPSYKTGYVKGVLAMANSGPNTNGSQFFITVADDTQKLEHKYTIFGRVTSGQEAADKISELPTSPPGDGQPIATAVMESVKIIK